MAFLFFALEVSAKNVGNPVRQSRRGVVQPSFIAADAETAYQECPRVSPRRHA